jgi:glycosyltransferase involved in cell wall biosynthesis
MVRKKSMRYTIVTPTICRPSLLRLCESIDQQTESDWEHLVVIDTPRGNMTKEQRNVIESIRSNAKRSYSHCDRRHNNYGHTCRHHIWEQVRGDYILYVDDDDSLADENVLKTLDSVTEPWAVFPMLRHGKRFLCVPPARGGTGTGMFLHRREIGRWPDRDSYDADGWFVEELKQRFPYQVVESRPLVIQPQSSCGVSNAESWWGAERAKWIARWFRYKDLLFQADFDGKSEAGTSLRE